MTQRNPASQTLERTPFVVDKHGNEQAIWFEDGTIVLQAESSVYRVYRGVLSAHSDVFSDLFSLPQSTQQETYQGTPLVVLPDDALDLYYFLRALCDHGKFYADPLSGSTEFAAIAGVLRLSTKYEVDHLRQQSIHALTAYYPTTLAEYEQRKFWSATDPDTDFHVDLQAVSLLREAHVLSLLPAALLECTYYNQDAILPGSAAEHRPMLKYKDDRALVIKLQLSLLHLDLFLNRQIAEGEGGACGSPVCLNARHQFYLATEPSTFDIGFRSRVNARPFESDRSGISWERDSPTYVGMCKACFEGAKKKTWKTRTTAWNQLPSTIGLGSWEEILRPDEEDDE